MYQRIQQDALALRLCRTAEQLASEYANFVEYAQRVPDDEILTRLMDQEVFLPRAAKYQILVDSLRQEAPKNFPRSPEFAVPDSALGSAQLAEKMQDWIAELESRYRCPELLVPEKYIQQHVATQPRVYFAAPAWERVFAPALERNVATAAEYRKYAQHDAGVMCKSRDGLVKARVIHDYLRNRCAKAKRQRNSSLKCDEPLRRSERQVNDLAAVVLLNETKFKEKWSKWLNSTAVDCAGRT